MTTSYEVDFAIEVDCLDVFPRANEENRVLPAPQVGLTARPLSTKMWPMDHGSAVATLFQE
jgi:hypothetical protein